MQELCKNDLAAESKKNATYSIRLLELNEGFAVETKRGCAGKVTGCEAYWRQTKKEAQALYDGIVRKKTTPPRKRVYKESSQPQETQCLLF